MTRTKLGWSNNLDECAGGEHARGKWSGGDIVAQYKPQVFDEDIRHIDINTEHKT